jgi:hypothetical protein
MDSLSNQKAVNSHHSKVRIRSFISERSIIHELLKVASGIQNNKTSGNQGTASNLKGSQSEPINKDSNFEYEDNEWDIGKMKRNNAISIIAIVNFRYFRNRRFNN